MEAPLCKINLFPKIYNVLFYLYVFVESFLKKNLRACLGLFNTNFRPFRYSDHVCNPFNADISL